MEAIGDQWNMVGIVLLDDESGAIVDCIADEFRGKAQNINLEILKRWIRGEGIRDRSWRALIGVLRSVRRVALADSVEEALEEEEAEQGTHIHMHACIHFIVNTVTWELLVLSILYTFILQYAILI